MPLHLNIRHLRKEKNLSQSDLGELIGVTRQQIATYESGNSTIPLASVLKMSDIFNISLDDLCKKEIKNIHADDAKSDVHPNCPPNCPPNSEKKREKYIKKVDNEPEELPFTFSEPPIGYDTQKLQIIKLEKDLYDAQLELEVLYKVIDRISSQFNKTSSDSEDSNDMISQA